MSTTETLLSPDLRLRKISLSDLARFHRTDPTWIGSLQPGKNLLLAPLSRTASGHVVEVCGRLAGFTVYRKIEERARADPGLIKRLFALVTGYGRRVAKPLQIELLNITVLPAWRRQGIGRRLLAELDRQLKRPGDCVWAMVPETTLALQLFLRDCGYRAVRVFRERYGDEDGYLMQRLRT